MSGKLKEWRKRLKGAMLELNVANRLLSVTANICKNFLEVSGREILFACIYQFFNKMYIFTII